MGPDPGTYILTENLSEYHIRPDGSIWRMGAMSIKFTQCQPPGQGRDTIHIGQPMRCYDPNSGLPTLETSKVISVRYVEPTSPQPEHADALGHG